MLSHSLSNAIPPSRKRSGTKLVKSGMRLLLKCFQSMPGNPAVFGPHSVLPRGMHQGDFALFAR